MSVVCITVVVVLLVYVVHDHTTTIKCSSRQEARAPDHMVPGNWKLVRNTTLLAASLWDFCLWGPCLFLHSGIRPHDHHLFLATRPMTLCAQW